VTGYDLLDPKTLAILRAIDEAGRPLKTSEIVEHTELSRQSIAWHIKWRMLYKWLTIVKTERQPNGYGLRFYGITPYGRVRLEEKN